VKLNGKKSYHRKEEKKSETGRSVQRAGRFRQYGGTSGLAQDEVSTKEKKQPEEEIRKNKKRCQERP
jgi:hypothetical protein